MLMRTINILRCYTNYDMHNMINNVIDARRVLQMRRSMFFRSYNRYIGNIHINKSRSMSQRYYRSNTMNYNHTNPSYITAVTRQYYTHSNTSNSNNSNNSNISNNEYQKTILKKFIFQIHPDFFHHQQYQSQQVTNAENMKLLLARMNALDDVMDHQYHHQSQQNHKSKTRSLIFFIKPSEIDPEPRRVKVTLSRLIDSIREILDTVGIELPIAPEGESQGSSEYVAEVGELEFKEFMDSLIDRRELIAWRADRSQRLTELKTLVFEQLGVKSIDFRHSWSAQNNSMLLHTLLRLIEENLSELHLPWTGMDMVLTFDDASFLPVDALERQITLNPCQLPFQWLHSFNLITPDMVDLAKQTEKFMAEATIQVENNAAILIRRRISKTALSTVASTIKDMEAESFQATAMHTKLRNITVNIRKGYTCTKRKYLALIERILSPEAYRAYMEANSLDVGEEDHQSEINEENIDSRSGLGNDSTSAPEAGNKETALVLVDWVSTMPVSVSIVVEEGYGTKLLPSGEFRIDCRASALDIWTLLDKKSLEAVSLAAHLRRKQLRVDELRDALIELVGTSAVDAGVGVDLDQMTRCLEHLLDYANASEDNLRIVQKLRAMSVRVGMYLGVADDGACIVPWDLMLTRAGNDDRLSDDHWM